jgi:hypothetical protein
MCLYQTLQPPKPTFHHGLPYQTWRSQTYKFWNLQPYELFFGAEKPPHLHAMFPHCGNQLRNFSCAEPETSERTGIETPNPKRTVPNHCVYLRSAPVLRVWFGRQDLSQSVAPCKSRWRNFQQMPMLAIHLPYGSGLHQVWLNATSVHFEAPEPTTWHCQKT